VTVDRESATVLAHAPVVIPASDGGRSRLDRALCRFDSGVAWVELLTPPPPTS
jgi:hypothetical protein